MLKLRPVQNLAYLQRKNINESESLAEIVNLTGNNDKLQIKALPYGGDAVEVVIKQATGNHGP